MARASLRYWVKGRIPFPYLALALLISLAGLFVVESTKTQVKYRAYDKQVEAARLMEECLAEIKDLRVSLGIPINRELDPNETGMIGEEVTEITTSLGNLKAKRTSVNPAFAALMVRYFTEAGLREGDVVAIGASGSFPALIIATLSAARVMGLHPVLIYSIGASTYGANIPELTFVQMLERLRERGLLPYEISAVSMGGDGDRALSPIFETTQDTIRKIAQESRAEFIYEESLRASIERRMRIYDQAAAGRPIRCFVNIGGALPNYGNTPATMAFPNGLVMRAHVSSSHPERGLIFEYAARGIPVVNLIDVQDLALANGLPVDPVPVPKVGEGGVYLETRYSRPAAAAVLAVTLGILVAGVAAASSEGGQKPI